MMVGGMSSKAHVVSSLAPLRALDLASLLMATEQRVPLAPTQLAAWTVIERLVAERIIECRGPVASSDVSFKRTSIERFPWQYVEGTPYRSVTLEELNNYLLSMLRDEPALQLRLSVWNELLLWESTAFLQQQLAKHFLDPDWADDLTYLPKPLLSEISIGQWRYVIWAAVRKGAAKAQAQAGSRWSVRDTIYEELQRRLRYARQSSWTAKFTHPRLKPDSAMSRTFVECLSTLGADFWTCVPSTHALYEMPVSDGQAAAGRSQQRIGATF